VVREFEENLSWSQRLADKVAELNGSWAFILVLIGLTAAWCIANFPPVAAHIGLYTRGEDGKVSGFDPYPFILYNLVLAVLVSLQGPLIVMSQNRQTAKDRAKADVDYHVNLKNEIGIERMLAELASMRTETNKRFEVLERHARAERLRAEVPAKVPGGPFSAS
jgi:CRP/FNR family cyclic AMP-dependent transcriptional regulator